MRFVEAPLGIHREVSFEIHQSQIKIPVQFHADLLKPVEISLLTNCDLFITKPHHMISPHVLPDHQTISPADPGTPEFAFFPCPETLP